MTTATSKHPIDIEHSSRFLFFACMLGVVGFLVVILSAQLYGPGISPDSISYISSAKSFVNGEGLRDYDGAWFTSWPPLFPLLLSVGTYFGVTEGLFALYLNAACFGALIFFSTIAFNRGGSRKLESALGATLLLVSFPLLKNSIMVWSEPLFVLLILIGILGFVRYRRQPGVLPFLGIAGCAALAALQRYLGISVVLAFALLFLVWGSGNFRKRTQLTTLYLLLGGAPLSIWLFRNFSLTGTLSGPRVPSSTTVEEIVSRLMNVGSGLFVPPTASLSVSLMVGVVVAGLFLQGTVQALLDKREGEGRFIVIGSAAFVMCYGVVLAGGTLTIGLEPISIRYLSPVIPFVLLCAFAGMSSAPRLKSVYTVLVVGHLLWSLAVTIELTEIWRTEGAGDYTVKRWEESQLLNWLNQTRPTEFYMSNASDLIFFKTGLLTERLPHKGSFQNQLSDLVEKNGSVHMAIFKFSFRRYMVTTTDISDPFRVEVVETFEDGEVVKVTR